MNIREVSTQDSSSIFFKQKTDLAIGNAHAILLKDLCSFVALLEKSKKLSNNTAEIEKKIVDLHESIIAKSNCIELESKTTELEQKDFNFIIAKAFLLSSILKDSLGIDNTDLDFSGSSTLYKYKVDFIQDKNLRQSDLIELCKNKLGLSVEQVDRLKQEISESINNATNKKNICIELIDTFNLSDKNLSSIGISNFLKFLYPETPISKITSKIVVTNSMIFICLPLDKNGDVVFPEDSVLDANEKTSMINFASKLKKFAQEKFANFPAFGTLDSSCKDTKEFRAIASKLELNEDLLYQQLKSMITILPEKEVDKYIVHDVWGHGWQANLLQFGNYYSSLAKYANPLELKESALNSANEKISFYDCFKGKGDSLDIDLNIFEKFVISEVEERLPLAMSPVLAEMFADLIEFKFGSEHPECIESMQSTSKLPDYPTKLDLSLSDVKFYFSQATKVFRLWSNIESRHKNTISQLMNTFNCEHAVAEKAVNKALLKWKELENNICSGQIAGLIPEDIKKLNLISRWYLNIASIHRSISETYFKLEDTHTENLPLRGFKEMLVIASSIFFEQNPRENFWKLDEFIGKWFIPLCQQLVGKDNRS